MFILNRKNIHTLLFTSAVAFILSACVPVYRTEYISPQWQGEFLLLNQEAAAESLRITDRFSGQTQELQISSSLLTKFDIPAATKQLSMKLPAASMARKFRLDIELQGFSLSIAESLVAASGVPQELDLGRIIIDFDVYQKSRLAPDEIRPLIESASALCQKQFGDAMYWHYLAKNIKGGAYSDYRNEMTSDLISRYYQRIRSQLYFSKSECFSDDCEKGKQYRKYVNDLIKNQ